MALGHHHNMFNYCHGYDCNDSDCNGSQHEQWQGWHSTVLSQSGVWALALPNMPNVQSSELHQDSTRTMLLPEWKIGEWLKLLLSHS